MRSPLHDKVSSVRIGEPTITVLVQCLKRNLLLLLPKDIFIDCHWSRPLKFFVRKKKMVKQLKLDCLKTLNVAKYFQ